MTNKERLNELYKKYGLTQDDYFKSPQGWTIITRSGIDKIQSEANIKITYDTITVSPKFVVIKAKGVYGDNKIETYGEADRESNCRQTYPVAMAEKRAMSRVVLKLAGFYELGAFGEDESDDFKRPKKYPKKLVEGTNEYEGIVAQLKDGSITMNDVLKEYVMGDTTRYQLDNIARG